MRSSVLTVAWGATAILICSSAYADIPGPRLSRALSQLPDQGARFLRLSGSGASDSEQSGQFIVRVQGRAEARALGLIPTSEHFAVGARPHAEWSTLSGAPGVRGLSFSPARSLLLDLATPRVSLEAAQTDYGVDGSGVIVGVIDTGADAAHPALLLPDGTSRISWMLAFDKEPLGLHPELEEEYGCTSEEDPCAIYSREDINEILDSQILSQLPKDRIGHGTHLASIAAGSPSEYPGVAPGADLIIVKAAGEAGTVTDPRILLGARFVFDRAAEAQKPAAVNISLGSSFGAHDGTSAVEEGLAELAAGPGRAIVVASGNSGQIYTDLSDEYPEPFGIHNQVAVPPKSTVQVPLLTTPNGREQTEGTIFAWISTFPGQSLSVAFHNGKGGKTELVPSGSALGFSSTAWQDDSDEYDVLVLNGVESEIDAEINPGSAVVALVGSWESGRTFELILEGEATANIWLTGGGGASANVNGLGPLLTRARRPGTVAIPGSHPDLVTVGASHNRSAWIDYLGNEVGYEEDDLGLSSYSAAGPNQEGDLKPEVIAPGTGIIAAMSSSSDPRKGLSPFSQFQGAGSCPDETECFVIDDEHGIASGTSMAAPLATGTIALLMQRNPELTMKEAKSFMMTGAQRLNTPGVGSAAGTGELNIVGALLAQDLAESGEVGGRASAEHSRTLWADDFVHPSPAPALTGYVLLRDEDNEIIGVPEDLHIQVRGPGTASWEADAPGLARLTLTADANTSGQELEVIVSSEDTEISRQRVTIAADPQIAEFGYSLVGGTCSLVRSGAPAPGPLALLVAMISLTIFRRRRQASR